MVLADKTFSLRALCEEVCLTGRHAFAGRKATLTLEIDDEPFFVRGSPRHLKQVLKNLVSNACKFVTKGGASDNLVTLSVKLLAHHTPDTSTFRIAVSDTGPGIALAEQTRIFAVYSQVGVKRGTGLGLPLAKGFVELMGGTLRVTSPWRDDGMPGAKFHFSLTLPNGTPDDGGSVLDMLPALPTKWRVLLADDSAIIRLTVSHVLARAGQGLDWTVDQVDTAEKAVAKAVAVAGTKAAYALIIIDQDFGAAERMRGTQATTIMRAGGVDALILGFTGNSTEGHNKRALAAGQDAVIGKPFVDEEKFKRILQGLLQARARSPSSDRQQGGSTPTPPPPSPPPSPPLSGLTFVSSDSSGDEGYVSYDASACEASVASATSAGMDDAEYGDYLNAINRGNRSLALHQSTSGDTPGLLPCVDEQHRANLSALGDTAAEDLAAMFRQELFDHGETGGATLASLLVAQRFIAIADPTNAASLEAIDRAAHSIKGSAGTVGCPALEQVAGDIIDAAQAGKKGGGGSPTDWDELASRFEAERERFERYCVNSTGGV